jgi:hypothetical protein
MASCVQLGAVNPAGDELPLSSGLSRADKRRRSALCVACSFQGVLTVVLIALVAWVGATGRALRSTIPVRAARRGVARACGRAPPRGGIGRVRRGAAGGHTCVRGRRRLFDCGNLSRHAAAHAAAQHSPSRASPHAPHSPRRTCC